MKKYIKLALPIFIGLLASCSAEENLQATDGSDSPENGKKMTFTANIDTDVTRTHFDTDQKTVWSESDKIWICNPAAPTNKTNYRLQFDLTSGGNSKTGTFEATQNIAASTNPRTYPDCFYAVYPCNNDVSIARDGNSYTKAKVTATIPAEQAAEETLSTRYQYLTAYTTGSSLSFKNVVSFFKVTVKSSDDFKISRIKIVANNTTKTTANGTTEYYDYLNIAGTFTSSISNSGADAGRVTIKNADISEGSSFVTTTITPSKDSHTYYLAVLPTTEGSSLNFTLLLESDFSTTTHGQKIYQATKQGLEFKPGKVYDLGTFDAANLSSKVLDNVVDLDLPSGTIWCNKDLGSDAVGFPGPYIMWGQIQNEQGAIVQMTDFTDATYQTLANLKYTDSKNNTVKKYNGTGADNVGELGSEDDAVYKVNNRFAMPTFNQARELTREGVNTWPIVDPTFDNCCRVQNKAKNRYIVLSKMGTKGTPNPWTNRVSYWSKTRQKGNNRDAYWYDFVLTNSTYNGRVAGSEGDPVDPRYYGRMVRGVVINKNIAPVKTYAELSGK